MKHFETSISFEMSKHFQKNKNVLYTIKILKVFFITLLLKKRKKNIFYKQFEKGFHTFQIILISSKQF